MSEAKDLNQLRDALMVEGIQPLYHRRIMRQHMKEWPVLWTAIEALFAEDAECSDYIHFVRDTRI